MTSNEWELKRKFSESLAISYLLADAAIWLNEYRDNGLEVAQLARSFYSQKDYSLMREIRSRINAKREEMFNYARNN